MFAVRAVVMHEDMSLAIIPRLSIFCRWFLLTNEKSAVSQAV
jgi:hypothetical protein